MRVTILPLLMLALFLPACAGTGADYQPMVDGPKNMNYSADLNSCQSLATEKLYLNANTQMDAGVGAAVGALAGAAEDGFGGAAVGAILGGVVGAGSGAYQTIDTRQDIVRRCMQGRGHRVVG